jgi:hypothetical protein
LGVLKDYHLLMLRLCGTGAVLMALPRRVEIDSVGLAVFGVVSVIEWVHRTVQVNPSAARPRGDGMDTNTLSEIKGNVPYRVQSQQSDSRLSPHQVRLL